MCHVPSLLRIPGYDCVFVPVRPASASESDTPELRLSDRLLRTFGTLGPICVELTRGAELVSARVEADVEAGEAERERGEVEVEAAERDRGAW